MCDPRDLEAIKITTASKRADSNNLSSREIVSGGNGNAR